MELPELREDFGNKNRKAIQETTLAKDVLARFQCNTLDEVKAAVGLPFTAIVIGSGMYGAFCAERIYRRGGRVLVLDAGPFVVSEHVQNMADPAFDVAEAENLLGLSVFGEFRSPFHFNDNKKRPIIFAGQNYNVGGKSVRWGGWSPRLTEEDLEQYQPDMKKYFKDFYREIEFQIGAFPTGDFIKGPLAEVIYARVNDLKGKPEFREIKEVSAAPIAAQAEQPASGLFSFDKYSSLPVLIETLRGDAKAAFGNSLSNEDANSRKGIMLVPRCRVLRLETEAVGNGKRRVTALRVIHGNEKPVIDLFPVPPECSVVLAANSMESTRLALESFVEPQNVASTKIGRNFQVHLRTDIIVRIPRANFEAELKDITRQCVEARQKARRSPFDPPDPRTIAEQVSDMLESLQTAALHIQCSDGSRRYHLQLLGVSDPGGNPEALLYRQDTSLPELTNALGRLRSSWIAVKFILVGEIIGDRDSPIGRPDRAWVTLSEFERDSFIGQGNPQLVSQEYSARKLYAYVGLTEDDEKLWLKMDKLALDIAEELAGAGRIEYFSNNRWSSVRPSNAQLANLHQSLGSTYHECGTMWTDPDPNRGVVDLSGRFHDVENAYCCDQAVFVTSGSANPVPTGLIIAKRVSEAIMPDHEINEKDFTNLFIFPEPKGDYKTLPVGLGLMPKGWKFVGQGGFVRRGKMMESAGGIGLLYYDDEVFRDFILKLEWRCPLPRGKDQFFNNSGVYIRWPREITVKNGKKQKPAELSLEEFTTYAIKQGYEVQIDDTGYRPEPEFSGFPQELHNPYHLTGAIYPAYFPPPPPFKVPRFDVNAVTGDRTGSPAQVLRSRPPGQWNEFLITAQGNKFRVELNGDVVNEATDHNNAYPEGFIGLQNHFNGYRVQFRNLRIKKQ
jgi:hypothetical protein